MKDYERIAAAIRFLDTHRDAQPDVTTVAAHVGLGASHFHRMFCTWAGATPEDFLQCLTLSQARALLRRSESVLAAVPGSRLSGPDRPQDLRITLEAATPGEIKGRGAGLEIRAGIAGSPFGNCLIAETPCGICHLSFFDEGGREAALAELRADWPLAGISRDDPHAARLCGRLFSSAPDPSAPWKLHLRGTAFQLRVWRALLHVPPGALVSYAKLAAAAGNPKAARATGSAVGRNAVSFLIPCHRVIRESGLTGDYRWGATRKRAMLAWEQSRADG